MARALKHLPGLALAALTLLAGTAAAESQPESLTVKVDQPGAKVSPMLYGLMTEEINHSYDGGLYAELIQNRNFKGDAHKPIHWSLVQGPGAKGTIALDTADPVNTTALTTSLRLDITTADKDQRVGVANEGYWGIPVKPATTYRAAFYARADAGFTGPLNVTIESNDGATVLASGSVPAIATKWQRYTLSLTTGQVAASAGNRFVISAEKPGTVWLSLVSLFPPTFNNHPNGNRIDIMEKLGAMRPAFLRLPGGNYLEGNHIDEHFAWKNTIHDIALRPGHPCCWGYPSSDGLGLLEYLEWCEDLHMEAVLAVFAGYALDGKFAPPGPELVPYVTEALDEIEYATGDESTPWGSQRVKDGHPAPFKIQYVEISNEDGGPSYDGRFAQFFDAIKAKYPALKLIATSPVHSRNADVLDDHYYRSARAMERDVHHYDSYSRNGPKIFVGEWASTEGSPTPTLQAALGDAAWLTGLERNSDLVVIASYAPLLVNVNPGAAQWGTNLIGYDALTSFGSPSYYAQKMFGTNVGDTILPVQIAIPAPPAPEVPAPQGAVGVGTWVTNAEYKDLKVTAGDNVLYQSDFAAAQGTNGWKLGAGQWKLQDGALRQSANDADCRATVGDPKWTDYTYRLKARKTGGSEGFLILFHFRDDNNFLWWNLGGWGNSHSALERQQDGQRVDLGQSAPVTIDTGRWYDIRIEVKGAKISCFLDDKLITESTDTALPPPESLFATASRVDATGEVILKVVNPLGTAQSIEINLQGVQSVDKAATVEVLSGQPADVNSVAQPEKVAPRREAISDAGTKFRHEFPPYSVSVLRFQAH